MIFKRLVHIVCVGTVMASFSGCIGTGDNSQQAGLEVHIAEVHVETAAAPMLMARLPVGAISEAPLPLVVPLDNGYDHDHLEHKEIHDKNGRQLSIYRAYVVINNIELEPCFSITQLPRMLGNGLVPMAAAHGGSAAEVGDRNLDAPNVIDILTQDENFMPLGDIAIAPGRYCGARVSFVRLASIGYGIPEYEAASADNPITEPETPDMSGKIFAIRADYCAAIDGLGACTQRIRVDVDDNGLNEPQTQTIAFDQPLEISARYSEVYVALGIAYGEWLSDVDITMLASDAGEQQKLLNNIAGSLHIYEKGIGEVPVNF